MCVILSFDVCRLAPKLSEHHADTEYIRKQKCHAL